jgi:hypothetical protein
VAPASGWSILGTGDFDGDGKSDILWQNASSGTVEEWLMNGSTVSATSDIATLAPGTGWTVAGIGDFNGDGKSDILWRNTASGSVQAWLMNGASALSQTTVGSVSPSSGWSIVGTGDFNGDSKSDILWRNSSTGTVEEWLMDGAGVSSTPDIATLAPSSGWSLAGIGDYDGDGRSDILWRDANTAAVQAWLMSGATIASATNIGSVPSSWSVVAGTG